MPIQAALLYANVTVAGAEDSVGKLRRVSGAVDDTQAKLNRFGGAGAQAGRGLTQLAGGVVRIGEKVAVAALVATGAASKIAASFEDAFATVEKTVEGTPQQLDAIDQALRRLSTNIPVTFQGLATIASEAGALGVATKDIVKFSEAVARTSAATVGLDPFAASEAFGKLSTIFGLSGERAGSTVSDYERLGSSLVALGNAGASSEADIIAVTKRFAAAGQIAGLSAAEVLGWSSALASLGPEAEAAGGALQRLFNRAARNIGLVGEKGMVGTNARKRVATFAAVTGMSVDEFVALYTKDASGAMQRFIQGLSGMDQFESAKALFGAGIINQRDILAIQAFSTRFDVLNDQLAISNRAWEEGTELQAVSARRFDTLRSKAIEFKNTILVGAAAFGEGMNPAIGRLLARAKEFVNLHLDDLGEAGRDLGDALDGIDWSAVGRGASDFANIIRGAVDLIKQIPPQVSLSVAAFLGLNKLSGGLLGDGLGNVVGGLGKAGANVLLNGLSRAPGIGGVIGAATATRVFVTNWPVGMGMGGPGGLPSGAAAGAGLSAGALAGWLGLGGIITYLLGHELAKVAHEADPTRFVDPTAPSGAGGSAYHGPGNSATADARGIVNPAAFPTTPSAAEFAAAAGLAAGKALINSGHGDELIGARTASNIAAIASNTAMSADRLARIAGIRVGGNVPRMKALDEIGSAEDPYGFKHIKSFSMGLVTPGRMEVDLVRHIKEIDEQITAANRKGDKDTVNKLGQTKAALQFLLGQVRDGTYRAGDKAYEGALLAAAAADRTTLAIMGLKPADIGGLVLGGAGLVTKPRTTSPTSSSGFVVPHGAVAVPMASGGIVRRRSGGVLALLGEGQYDERVEPLDGRGNVVEVRPGRAVFAINGREIARAVMPWTATARRRNA